MFQFYIPLKKFKKLNDVFRGYSKGTLAQNRLIALTLKLCDGLTF